MVKFPECNEIKFEHITRKNNVLADILSKKIAGILQQKSETALILEDSPQGTWLRTLFKTNNEYEISNIQGYGSLKTSSSIEIDYIAYMLLLTLLGRKMASSSRMTAREFRKKLATPKAEALQETPTKLFNFGPYQLFAFKENKFEALEHLQRDENQLVILGNLWNSKTQFHKHKALQAVSQYFSPIQKRPASKNFSYYVVVQGHSTGVFLRWNSVKRANEGHEWPIYKGFYTFEEALEFARGKLGHDFYIEEGPPVDILQANYELETELQEEENRKLKEKVMKLESELMVKNLTIRT